MSKLQSGKRMGIKTNNVTHCDNSNDSGLGFDQHADLQHQHNNNHTNNINTNTNNMRHISNFR